MTPQEKLESVIKTIEALKLLYGEKLEKLPEEEKAIFAEAILGNRQAKNVDEVNSLTQDTIDKDLTVSDLRKRYGLGRSGFYNRLKALGMTPAYYKHSMGFFTNEQVALLDKLDAWFMKNGQRTYKEFCIENNIY